MTLKETWPTPVSAAEPVAHCDGNPQDGWDNQSRPAPHADHSGYNSEMTDDQLEDSLPLRI